MSNKLLRKLVGFVTYLVLACFMGCGGTKTDDQNIPAKGGNAGQAGSAGSSIGGNVDASAIGGSGGAVDAGLGGSAGSSGIGGSAGTSTGGSAGQAGSDAGDDAPYDAGDAGQAGSAGSSTGGSAGQAGSDAGEDAPYDAGDAGQAGSDAGVDVSSDVASDVSSDGGLVVFCPTCDELLTWDTTQYKHSSLGKISTSENWDDSYAWKMLNTCTGWGIVGGHEGGTGDTLEIGACNDGLVLIWAYNSFSSIRLSQGWTGNTDTNLGIGASYQAFIQMYPDYTANSLLIDGSGYAMLVYANGIAVFNDSMLSELRVY
ncbi:MAG: hypothetical protein WC641_07150 [Patescibacteria group bacterium]